MLDTRDPPRFPWVDIVKNSCTDTMLKQNLMTFATYIHHRNFHAHKAMFFCCKTSRIALQGASRYQFAKYWN